MPERVGCTLTVHRWSVCVFLKAFTFNVNFHEFSQALYCPDVTSLKALKGQDFLVGMLAHRENCKWKQ